MAAATLADLQALQTANLQAQSQQNDLINALNEFRSGIAMIANAEIAVFQDNVADYKRWKDDILRVIQAPAIGLKATRSEEPSNGASGQNLVNRAVDGISFGVDSGRTGITAEHL